MKSPRNRLRGDFLFPRIPSNNMRIINLNSQSKTTLRQAAQLLVDEFKETNPEAWPTLRAAQREVRQALASGRICHAALNDDGTLLGWIGAISTYSGRVRELHPMVVGKTKQRKGIGTALIRDLEIQTRKRGGRTLYLGTDDEAGLTSLANVDLYDNTLGRIKAIKNLKRHPYEFYQKVGFTNVGGFPDANGAGKPDIFMAKRIQ